MRLMTLLAVAVLLTGVSPSSRAAPIHDAARTGQTAKLAKLLKKSPKLLNARDRDLRTPLHYAAAAGKLAAVKSLLDKRALVDARRRDGATPLHEAVVFERGPVIRLLIEKGAKLGDVSLVLRLPRGASVLRSGRKLKGLKPATLLKQGDLLSGGTKGNFDVSLASTVTLRLRPAALVRLLRMKRDAGAVDIGAKAGRGTVLTRLRPLTGQSRFILETPGAITAARGTAYLTRVVNVRTSVMQRLRRLTGPSRFKLETPGAISVTRDTTDTPDTPSTEVLVAEGKVGVALAKDPSVEVGVEAGSKVIVAKDTPPQPEAATGKDAADLKELLNVKPPSEDLATVGTEYDFPLPGGGTIRMVYVPAGAFLMGNTDTGHDTQTARTDTEKWMVRTEHPQHQVYLSGYWIAKYETTRGQYRRFMDAGGYRNPGYWSADGWAWVTGRNRTQPDAWEPQQNLKANPPWLKPGDVTFTQTDDFPVVGVSYYEAQAFCRWAGLRLPTEAQWDKAARWDPIAKHPRVFPWGDEWDGTRAACMDNFFPQTAHWRAVGSIPSGVSPYGCMDMTGNVWEWIADWFDEDYYNQTPPGGWVNPTGPTSGTRRGSRGGSWTTGFSRFYTRPSYRGNEPPSLTVLNHGFRCAR